jgi:hypothetical protein
MKLSKKNLERKNKAHPDFVPQDNRFVPFNLDEYPPLIWGTDKKYCYSRFWVRPRFVAYEIYNRAELLVGFQFFFSGGTRRIEGKPMQMMWTEMEKLGNELEKSNNLIIAKNG